MIRIFISHSSKDQEFVRSVLKPLLDGPEMSAWCSSTDLLLAADWHQQIHSALVQTHWFLVVLSPDAQQSPWVQAETHWALEHLSGRVIPVMARTCEPGDVHLRLGTLQFIDFRSNPVGAAQQLLDVIHGRSANEPTRFRVQIPADVSDRTVIRKQQAHAEVSLFIETAAKSGYEHHLSIRDWATIGRADDADLRIADDCVSRKHARMSTAPSPKGAALMLSDLGSANGTFVNGQRIASDHLLASGDLIEIGDTRIRVLAIA